MVGGIEARDCPQTKEMRARGARAPGRARAGGGKWPGTPPTESPAGNFGLEIPVGQPLESMSEVLRT